MSKTKTLTLEVQPARPGEVYEDRVRIPAQVRGRDVRERQICLLQHGRARCLVEVRGDKGNDAATIKMDASTRHRLKVQEGQVAVFGLRKATRSEELRWGLQASAPAVRIQSRVALMAIWLGWWSLGLGAVSLLLGLLSLAVALPELINFIQHLRGR